MVLGTGPVCNVMKHRRLLEAGPQHSPTFDYYKKTSNVREAEVS